MIIENLPRGTKVTVLDENGYTLFHGTIADTEAPFVFWNRIVPDGYVDLPPKFRVVRRENRTEPKETRST